MGRGRIVAIRGGGLIMPAHVTNKYNLPQPLVDATIFDPHKSPGDISVTTLIDAPKPARLKAHFDFEEDVVDRAWAMFGQAAHNIAERAGIAASKTEMIRHYFQAIQDIISMNLEEFSSIVPAFHELSLSIAALPKTKPKYLIENLLTLTLDNGMVLSGTVDNYDVYDQWIYDYKVTSVFNVMRDPYQKKWREQVGYCYAYLLKHGYSLTHAKQSNMPVRGATIICILKDWSSFEASQDRTGNYPQSQFYLMDIPVVSDKEALDFINERANLHLDCRSRPFTDLPDCSEEERWQKPDKYCVMKTTRKSPLRRFDTMKQANDHIKFEGLSTDNHYVDKKPGFSTRCMSYCPVSMYCKQYQDILKNQ